MGGAPKEVIELIEQFERNIESYKRQGYKEASGAKANPRSWCKSGNTSKAALSEVATRMHSSAAISAVNHG